MRIALIGCGAMGSIFGSLISKNDDIVIIDKKAEVLSKGITIIEGEEEATYFPRVLPSSEGLGATDLVILFTKSFMSEQALSESRNLIGENTVILSLQNGSGHDEVLLKFVPEERMLLGTVENNGSVISPGRVAHGGRKRVNLGGRAGNIRSVAEVFSRAGFEVVIHDDINALIWNKLIVNATLSTVTALLSSDMAYVANNPHAWRLCESLIDECVEVAAADGVVFDPAEIKKRIRETGEGNPGGYTSIEKDIEKGRRTEVDTILGSVVRKAGKYGIYVPVSVFAVTMIHALESLSP